MALERQHRSKTAEEIGTHVVCCVENPLGMRLLSQTGATSDWAIETGKQL